MTAYIECKTSNISNMYGQGVKREIAKIVEEHVPTCDEIELVFYETPNVDRERKLFETGEPFQQIARYYQRGADGKETRLLLSDSIGAIVIQRPPITLAKDEIEFEVELGGIKEDRLDGERRVGFTFMRDGRSIGVYEVVGDLDANIQWILTNWLTAERTDIAGIGFLTVGEGGIDREVRRLRDIPNRSAANPFELDQIDDGLAAR